MRIRFDHVNVRTPNLQGMIDFYTEVLGLRLGPRPPFTFNGAWLYAGDQAVVHLVEVPEAPRPRVSSGSSTSPSPQRIWPDSSGACGLPASNIESGPSPASARNRSASTTPTATASTWISLPANRCRNRRLRRSDLVARSLSLCYTCSWNMERRGLGFGRSARWVVGASALLLSGCASAAGAGIGAGLLALGLIHPRVLRARRHQGHRRRHRQQDLQREGHRRARRRRRHARLLLLRAAHRGSLEPDRDAAGSAPGQEHADRRGVRGLRAGGRERGPHDPARAGLDPARAAAFRSGACLPAPAPAPPAGPSVRHGPRARTERTTRRSTELESGRDSRSHAPVSRRGRGRADEELLKRGPSAPFRP